MNQRQRLAEVRTRLEHLGNCTPEDRTAAQLAALRECVAHHYRGNATWRALCDAKRVTPDHLRTLEDLRRLPIVERDFLARYAFRHGEGGALSVPMSGLTSFLSSSGSTGRSKRIPLAEQELPSIAETCAMGVWLAGMRGHESGGGTMLPIFPHGPWPGAHFTQNGCEILGFSPKSDMGLPMEWHRRNLEELGVHSIITTPSFLSAFERHLREHGDPAGYGLNRIVLGGEFFGEGFRTEMERRFGCKVLDLYGCGETQIVLTESDDLRAHRPGWMYHLAHASVIEIVKPGTDDPVPAGTPGEMLITVLNRRAWPVVRYRTGDIVAADPERTRANLSWTLPLYSRIQGRADDMLKYGNVMLFPETFFQALARYAASEPELPLSLDKFRFEISANETDANRAVARLTIELGEGEVEAHDAGAIAAAGARVLEALTAQSDELHHALFVGRQVPVPEIVLVDASTLYRQEQKLRRMIDHRQRAR